MSNENVSMNCVEVRGEVRCEVRGEGESGCKVIGGVMHYYNADDNKYYNRMDYYIICKNKKSFNHNEHVGKLKQMVREYCEKEAEKEALAKAKKEEEKAEKEALAKAKKEAKAEATKSDRAKYCEKLRSVCVRA